MALHFISDLHLDPTRPKISALFLAYLQGPAREAEALYILGDLFEVWADDDVSAPLYQREIDALAALAASGVKIYFLCGNRDFLCGSKFAKAASLTLIKEPHLIQHGEDQIAVMHGDVLCTDDVGYQRFRRVVRWPWLQALYRCLPGSLKLSIAQAIRGQTRQITRLKPEDILDVNHAAVESFFAENPACKLLVHGHTHRPAQHALDHGRSRIVLADWHDDFGEYLAFDAHGWRRHALTESQA